MSKINVELLEKTLKYIEEHPQEWDQEAWCGSSCCFAGRACLLSGDKPVGDEYPSSVTLPNGARMTVGVRAEELLGLSMRDATRLFSGGNNLEDLQVIVQELKEKANG